MTVEILDRCGKRTLFRNVRCIGETVEDGSFCLRFAVSDKGFCGEREFSFSKYRILKVSDGYADPWPREET